MCLRSIGLSEDVMCLCLSFIGCRAHFKFIIMPVTLVSYPQTLTTPASYIIFSVQGIKGESTRSSYPPPQFDALHDRCP